MRREVSPVVEPGAALVTARKAVVRAFRVCLERRHDFLSGPFFVSHEGQIALPLWVFLIRFRHLLNQCEFIAEWASSQPAIPTD